jgi:hypothetical protein
MTARDYVEFVVADIGRTKALYGAAFGWTFTDYGPGYASFSSETVDGGFTTDGEVRTGGPLMVFARTDLDEVLERVKAAGGRIVRETFDFPGGRRFHFEDPDGYEIAVWSET